MEQALQLMPARCSRCGTLFDLQYDMDVREMDEVWSKKAKVAARMKLCWGCRV